MQNHKRTFSSFARNTSIWQRKRMMLVRRNQRELITLSKR
jgi:hypothetical protein